VDRKSKIFWLVFSLLILGSVAAAYWRIVIRQDYVVEAQTDCDPRAEACFVWECDPNSTVEGEACIGDPEEDIWFYKINKRNASRIPLCDPDADETCDPWTCDPGEEECEEIFCDAESAAEQEVSCNDPVKYTAENPIEEEVECAGDDPECEAAVEEETVECPEGDEECSTEEEAIGDETISDKEDAASETETEEETTTPGDGN
jgi:hypothetical protein